MFRRLSQLFSIFVICIGLLGARPELPLATDAPSAADEQARERLTKILPGRIIFDSNRGKGFGIHIADAKGSVTEFVDTARHEM